MRSKTPLNPILEIAEEKSSAIFLLGINLSISPIKAISLIALVGLLTDRYSVKNLTNR